jgi:hypothetical protein
VSRAAAALAYGVPEPAYPPPADETTYRLLGARSGASPRRVGTSAPAGRRHRSRAAHLEIIDEVPYRAYAPPRDARQPVRHSITAKHLRVSGFAVLAIGLAGVFAVARSGEVAAAQGRGFAFSGYADLSTTTQSIAEQAPMIAVSPDTPQPAPLAPEPLPHSDPATDYTVLGPPSLSVGQIEAVLREYGSPAVGLGQALYDLGIRYGIDPAYALAFFVHESACGTKGVARSTKSVGNIRWTEGYDNYEGYRSYRSWEAGMDDWYKLITELYINGWNLRTVDQIVPVYAPWGDNNHPPTYIASVKAMVDSWRGK